MLLSTMDRVGHKEAKGNLVLANNEHLGLGALAKLLVIATFCLKG